MIVAELRGCAVMEPPWASDAVHEASDTTNLRIVERQCEKSSSCIMFGLCKVHSRPLCVAGAGTVRGQVLMQMPPLHRRARTCFPDHTCCLYFVQKPGLLPHSSCLWRVNITSHVTRGSSPIQAAFKEASLKLHPTGAIFATSREL